MNNEPELFPAEKFDHRQNWLHDDRFQNRFQEFAETWRGRDLFGRFGRLYERLLDGEDEVDDRQEDGHRRDAVVADVAQVLHDERDKKLVSRRTNDVWSNKYLGTTSCRAETCHNSQIQITTVGKNKL